MPPKYKNLPLTPQAKERLKGVPLPEKIKCNRCEIFHGTSKYSHNQLDRARIAIRDGGRNARYAINCNRCAGGQIVEITCLQCNKTKGLEEFAKAQRTDPSDAKCYKCMAKQVETPPINGAVYEKLTTSFLPHDAKDWPSYWFGTEGSTASEANNDDDAGQGGGVPLPNPGFGNTSGTLIDSTDNSRASSNFGDAVRSQVASASTPGSGRVNNSFHSTRTERSGSELTPTKNGWAKIKAYKPEPIHAPAKEQDDWNSESEDDGGDSDSDCEI